MSTASERPPEPTTQDLAIERTLLALERTMMGWMRTAVSMTGFGFTIFKFFQYFRAVSGLRERHGLLGSRGLALMLVGSSTVLLLLAMAQYRDYRRRMVTPRLESRLNPVLIGSWLLVAIGLVTFGAIALTPSG